MGRKKVGRHYPPAVIKYREAHPQINISVPRAIKEEIERLADEINRDIHEKKDEESPSSWCRRVITNVFDKDFQKRVLSEVIILELGKEAKTSADKYHKEKKREADELYEKVVEYKDSLIAEGIKQGHQAGLEKGEVRGRERAEREFENALREAEEGREEAEKAAKEEGRKEGHEKAKGECKSIVSKMEGELNQKLKKQEKNFSARLKAVEEEQDEKFNTRESLLNAKFKKTMKANYDKGHTDGWMLSKDYYFDLGYKAGLKDRGLFWMFQRSKK